MLRHTVVSDLPSNLPDELLAHLIRVAAVYRVSMSPDQLKSALEQPDAVNAAFAEWMRV